MKEYILIGGAPLVGKSTIVFNYHDYIHVSTDDIRSLMQNLYEPESNEDLFYGYQLNAEQFYDKYKSAQKVFELEKKQAEETQKGVEALIKSDFNWNKILIEGIAITPEFVRKLEKSYSQIKFQTIFLYDNNKERIKKRLFSRGLYDYANKYPDELKFIELEWVILYNAYFKTEAEKYGFKIINVDDL
ncbi:hypothetical protein KC669_04685 [Candidatus Dojkabacteria bacterium]|uniref:UDP-N-acetylglucosamine kinase n=1 Tax=Candidatus Dojkabacteria bacterium TaxID=2099670 RepID=A0A955LBW4_9BACT|nr:hypothetical protein [Candidatus Dojkabacteria bacterium]